MPGSLVQENGAKCMQTCLLPKPVFLIYILIIGRRE